MNATSPPLAHNQFVVRPDWLALRQEEIIEPGLPIVDAHHHFWNRDGIPYFLPELLADIGTGHNIVATVFMECKAMYRKDAAPALQPLGEVEFVNGIAAMSASGEFGPTRVAAGIVGYADLGLGGAVREVLEAEIAAGGGRFRGVRNISAWHPVPEARGSSANATARCADAALRFAKACACLTSLGLSFDAWMYHTQLGELTELARAHPGRDDRPQPRRRRDRHRSVRRPARRGVRRMARVDRRAGSRDARTCTSSSAGWACACSVSTCTRRRAAAILRAARQAWRPYIETCIEQFGPTRAMFESNFPVDKGSCSYQSLWNAFKRIAAGASNADKQALFSGTATRVYRLDW